MAAARVYLDFPVELRDFDPSSGEYQAALPPGGRWGDPAAETVRLDYADIQEGLRDLENKDLFLDELIPLGEQLMDRLLPAGPLRARLVQAVQGCQPGEGLRLRLIVREPRLAQIPWEFCYLPVFGGEKDRRHFLALNPLVSLVRHTPMDEEAPVLEAATGEALRMLALMADPAGGGFEPLSLKSERRLIERALKDLEVDGVRIEWRPFIDDATPADFDQVLTAKPHIFHFSGHGLFTDRDDEASLVLVKDKEGKQPAYLPASRLGLHLRQAGVRLAYLGACQTSRQDGKTPWTAIAPALIAAGTPAVVAMQYKILDEFAITFSQAFYTSLVAGLSVDEAVTVGRLACLANSTDKGVEWGVPTLYMRSTDGILFSKEDGGQAKTADGIRTVVNQAAETLHAGGRMTGIQFKREAQPGEFHVTQKAGEVRGSMTGVVFGDDD
jgi:hypothetical protein